MTLQIRMHDVEALLSLKVGEEESGIVWWHWTFRCWFRLSGTGCVQYRVSADGFFIGKCGDSRSISIYTALKKKLDLVSL